MSFNEVNGKVFCFKYEPPIRQSNTPSKKEVDRKYIPEHFDTHQFLRELGNYEDSDVVFITQKNPRDFCNPRQYLRYKRAVLVSKII